MAVDRCSKCYGHMAVTNTIPIGLCVMRRRQCQTCKIRYNTYEFREELAIKLLTSIGTSLVELRAKARNTFGGIEQPVTSEVTPNDPPREQTNEEFQAELDDMAKRLLSGR